LFQVRHCAHHFLQQLATSTVYRAPAAQLVECKVKLKGPKECADLP